MKTLTFASQKGGSGKTTLAMNVTICAIQDGLRVAVIDQDPQGSLAHWFESREAEDPTLMEVGPGQMQAAIDALSGHGFDLVVVDTAGSFTDQIRDAIAAADLTIITAQPTAMDLRALAPTVDAVKAYRGAGVFVVTRGRGKGRTEQASDGLANYGLPVAPVGTSNLVAYQDAVLDGLGVLEHEPTGRAADEIRALWQYLRSTLHI